MALSVVQFAALSSRLENQPLFSHLPGFAVFGVGMLAGALAVLVSGWLRDHPQFGRPRPVPGRPAPALLTAPVPAARITRFAEPVAPRLSPVRSPQHPHPHPGSRSFLSRPFPPPPFPPPRPSLPHYLPPGPILACVSACSVP